MGIADHAVNILKSAEEMQEKELQLTEEAVGELQNLRDAIYEILDLSHAAFSREDYESARKTEPLEQVIDKLKEQLRTNHFYRLQKGECSAETSFVWSDLLTNLERVADHCSNISGCVLDTLDHTMNIHENQRIFRRTDEDFKKDYADFEQKYVIRSLR